MLQVSKDARKVLHIAKGAKKLPSNLCQLAEATRKKVDTRRRNT